MCVRVEPPRSLLSFSAPIVVVVVVAVFPYLSDMRTLLCSGTE